jgi:hypothetical protein
LNLLPWQVASQHPVPFAVLVGDHTAGGAADFILPCAKMANLGIRIILLYVLDNKESEE